MPNSECKICYGSGLKFTDIDEKIRTEEACPSCYPDGFTPKTFDDISEIVGYNIPIGSVLMIKWIDLSISFVVIADTWRINNEAGYYEECEDINEMWKSFVDSGQENHILDLAFIPNTGMKNFTFNEFPAGSQLSFAQRCWLDMTEESGDFNSCPITEITQFIRNNSHRMKGMISGSPGYFIMAGLRDLDLGWNSAGSIYIHCDIKDMNFWMDELTNRFKPDEIGVMYRNKCDDVQARGHMNTVKNIKACTPDKQRDAAFDMFWQMEAILWGDDAVIRAWWD